MRIGAVETVKGRLEADLSRRESEIDAMSLGQALLREAFGERGDGDGDARLSFATRDRVLEQVEQRVGETLTVQEEALRSIPFGRQCLSEVQGRSEDVEYERAQSRFEEEQRELNREEAAVEKDPAGEEFLRNARLEVLGAADREATLAERARIVKAAAALQKAAEAKREAEVAAGRDLDRREEALRSLSIGAKLLAAEQELLGKGKRPEALSARAAVVGDAERRADEALKGREEALRSRSLGERDGEPVAVEIDGAWLYESKLAALEAGRRQRGGLPDRGRREQALVWAEQQMERLDALHEAEALHPFFERLSELGPSHRPADIERSLDHAEEERRAAAARRQASVDALSGDEQVFFEEKLNALDPQRRETGIPKPTHVDAAVDYARARVVALDEEIEGRRAVIEQTPGDGHARLLAAGFGEASRQEKVEALAVMEADLAENFTRREERVRSDGAGEEFLERGRREVLGAAGRQAETLPERGRVIVAAETYLRQAVQRRRAEAERREARHQSISDTPGGDARLGAAGWDEARTDSERDPVLAIVERDLAADFERREEALRSDETGEALLRRGRLEVLEADREAATLAERGRIIERAEALRQKAEAERRRQAVAKKRVARLEGVFAVADGDKAFFAALDARKPAWRETGTGPADIEHALDVAEPQVERTKTKRVSAEHELIVEAEAMFPDMPSAACRQAGGKFADGATHARTLSQQRLSDRAQARSLAAERAEPPASADLVLRLFDWLRGQIVKLLDRLLPAVRKTPEVLPPVCRMPAVLPPIGRQPAVLPPVRRRPEVLPPVCRMPAVLPPIGRQPAVLPPVRRRPEVLPPVCRMPAVLPPIGRQPAVLPPVRRRPEVLLPVRKMPEVLPPVQRTPAVLPPVRTKPRVRTPQPDPLPSVIARIKDQHPNEKSSTWLQVKHQLFELHETPAGRTAQDAAEKLFHLAFTLEGFCAPLPPPAAPDRIKAIKNSLRECVCVRQERERLGLNLQPGLAPQRPAGPSRQKNRNPEHTRGGGFTPGGR